MSEIKRNLIFDVGMHNGEDTHFYLEKGFDVVAFEADPALVALCRRKFTEYIKQRRLVIVEGAVVDPTECELGSTVDFYRNQTVSVWGTLFGEWRERNSKLGADSCCTKVNTVNIVNYLHLHGIPYYMKVDIEGADVFCLHALFNFADRPTYISIESEKVDFRRLIGEIDLLERLGYTRFIAMQQGNVQSQLHPSPPLEGQFSKRPFPPGSSGLFGRELPGKWKTRREIVAQYRVIFALYKLFGDFGYFRRSWILRRLEQALQAPMPGWYDTHACRADSDL